MAHQLARAIGQAFDQVNQPSFVPEAGVGDAEEGGGRLHVRLPQRHLACAAQLRESESACALAEQFERVRARIESPTLARQPHRADAVIVDRSRNGAANLWQRV